MSDTPARPTTRRAASSDKEAPAINVEAKTEPKKAFSPRQYLEIRDGLPYLPLKWQLAWLRADHPQARLRTDLVSHENDVAIFKAQVKLEDGAVATGWGVKAASGEAEDHSENDGQLDYILLAENQALSRALAALGYGIEYAQGFDPPAERRSIPLPEMSYDSNEAASYEMPIMEHPATATETDDEADTDDDEQEEDAPIRPAPRGEIRAIFEKRPPLQTRPSASVPPPPAPAAPSAEAPAAPSPIQLVTPAVEERLKNVRDESLRLNIKRIYYEARRRYKYDEERVDKRSVELYGKPTFELDLEEAELYYERILNPPQRRS